MSQRLRRQIRICNEHPQSTTTASHSSSELFLDGCNLGRLLLLHAQARARSITDRSKKHSFRPLRFLGGVEKVPCYTRTLSDAQRPAKLEQLASRVQDSGIPKR